MILWSIAGSKCNKTCITKIQIVSEEDPDTELTQHQKGQHEPYSVTKECQGTTRHHLTIQEWKKTQNLDRS